MKKIIYLLSAIILPITVISCGKKGTVNLENKSDSLSYFIGLSQGLQYNQQLKLNLTPEQYGEYDKEAFLKGFKTALMCDTTSAEYLEGLTLGVQFARQIANLEHVGYPIDRKMVYRLFARELRDSVIDKTKLDWSNGTFYKMLSDIENEVRAKEMQKTEALRVQTAAENKLKGEEFINERKKADSSIQTTPSGLAYKVITEGSGPKVKDTDKVRIHYTGTLIDGTIFDDSRGRGKPVDFLPTEVVEGFGEGLKLMNKGAVYQLYIPSELGYGDNNQTRIPAGSTLIFNVEVLDINPN